jgi:HAD superfamily hydrolase (TIGR01509 family)
MNQLQALIFDVDGTLAETERDGHRVAFNRAFAKAGLDWHWSVELYAELLEVAGGKERIFHFISTHLDHFKLPEGQGSFNRFINYLHQTKNQYYQDCLRAGELPLRPGIKRLIQEARQAGIRLAIATTTTPENAVALLEATLGPKSPTWFEVIAAGDMVARKKPAPDVYEYALKHLGLAPEQCLAIEDTHQGLRSATQAGIATLITLNDYTQHQDFRGASAVLSHLGDPGQNPIVIAGSVRCQPYFTLESARQLLERQTARVPQLV